MDDRLRTIERDPEWAGRETYDVIVVGGGIHGCMIALEACRHGLRTLLLERADFGGGASWNSLRIVHGGLRYLQSLGLRRFRESIRERAWFAENFPDLVRPMKCLMPLYGKGLRRSSVFSAALSANDFAVRGASGGGSGRVAWPASRVVGPEVATALFPMVDPSGLQGAALWSDGFIESSPRLLIEIVHWICASGGSALNYMECDGFDVSEGVVQGVRAVDHATGRRFTFRGRAIVNAGGAAAGALARRAGGEHPELFHPALAFNLLLRRAPLSSHALGVSPKSGAKRSCFLVPWGEKILAGTSYSACAPPVKNGEGATALPPPPAPAEEEILAFLDELNRSVPGLRLRRDEVARVYAGYLPAEQPGRPEPRGRAMIEHHADRGGPSGFFSISGIKYTTARKVAEDVIRKVVDARPPDDSVSAARPRALAPRPPPLTTLFPDREAESGDRPGAKLHDPEYLVQAPRERVARLVTHMLVTESVVHLDDLLLRRTDWAADPLEGICALGMISPHLHAVEGWDHDRAEAEIARVRQLLRTTAGSSADPVAASEKRPSEPRKSWSESPVSSGNPLPEETGPAA